MLLNHKQNDSQFQADLRDEDSASLQTATFQSSRDSTLSLSSYEEVLSVRERLSHLGSSLPIAEEGFEIPTPSKRNSNSNKVAGGRPDTGGSTSSTYGSGYVNSRTSSSSRPISVSSSLFSNTLSGGGATLSSPSETSSSALNGFPSPSSGSSRMELEKELNSINAREKESNRPGGGIRRTASAHPPETNLRSQVSPILNPSVSQPQSPVVTLLMDTEDDLEGQELGLSDMGRGTKRSSKARFTTRNQNESSRSPKMGGFEVTFPTIDPSGLNLNGSLEKDEKKDSNLFKPLDLEALRLSLPRTPEEEVSNPGQPQSTTSLAELPQNNTSKSTPLSPTSLHRARTLLDRNQPPPPAHSWDRRPSLPTSTLYSPSYRSSPINSPEISFAEPSQKSISSSTSNSGLSKLSKLRKSSSSKSMTHLKGKGSTSISESNHTSSDEGFTIVPPSEMIQEEKVGKIPSNSTSKKGKSGIKAGFMKLMTGGNSSGMTSSSSVPTNSNQGTGKKESKKRMGSANLENGSSGIRSPTQTRRNQVADDIQVIGEYDATYGIPTFSNFGASGNSGISSPLTEGPSFGAYAIPASSQDKEVGAFRRTSRRGSEQHSQLAHFQQQVRPFNQYNSSKEDRRPSNTSSAEPLRKPNEHPQQSNLSRGKGSKRDSRSSHVQQRSEGRIRTTSMESLNGLLRKFGPRPSSSSGLPIGVEGSNLRRQSVIEHISHDESRRNSSRGPTRLNGDQLEFLRSSGGTQNLRPISPSHSHSTSINSLHGIRSPERPSRNLENSRPESSHSSMEGNGNFIENPSYSSSPNVTLATNFNSAHSQRWSTLQTSDSRNRSSITSSDFSPSQEFFHNNLSGSLSARIPSNERFQDAPLRRLGNSSMDALPFVQQSPHLANRRPSLGSISVQRPPSSSSSIGSTSKRWSSIWTSVAGNKVPQSPNISISRPISSSCSAFSDQDGAFSLTSPQLSNSNQLNVNPQHYSKFSPNTNEYSRAGAISPKTTPFTPNINDRRPSTSDAIYEKTFMIPSSAASLAAVTGSQNPQVQGQVSSLRPKTADQVQSSTSLNNRRRPSFGLNISPAAALAFDSIPSPQLAMALANGRRGSNEKDLRDGGVTGLGLSVTSSSGISNLSPKESHSNFNEEIHHQDQFNVLSFSDLKEERNSSKEFQDQILLNHPQHVGNSLADTPVTPASEEDKELMDLEFLNDDENLHDGDQIQVELEGGSPILNTRIFEGERKYGFV